MKSTYLFTKITVFLIIISSIISCQKGTKNLANDNVQHRLNSGDDLRVIIEKTPIHHLLGKSYQGGIICYLSPIDGKGMIISLDNLGEDIQWGCSGLNIGADETELGLGQKNTNQILSACPFDGISADLCDKYESDGYDDWFLPSKDELFEILLGLRTWGPENAKPISEITLWTSSEEDNARAIAYGYRFKDNFYSDAIFKNEEVGVRAVRTFLF